MTASIEFDDGRTINLSKETEKRLRKELLDERGFERVVDDLRISSRNSEYKGDFPVQVSILHDRISGSPKGEFLAGMGEGSIPGAVLSAGEAEDLINAIRDCLEYIRLNDC